MFPQVLGLLLASPDFQVFSCAAAGPAVAVLLNPVILSLQSLMWLKSLLLQPSLLMSTSLLRKVFQMFLVFLLFLASLLLLASLLFLTFLLLHLISLVIAALLLISTPDIPIHIVLLSFRLFPVLTDVAYLYTV
jgi:hypothetical protein